ncbi:UNKNOWN [Stylonychia lemnae]|uniref:3CxxC-type domain-containing protein n=1 Tax=Stylonychia lemnae TaxID=5949 RepID=A0A078B6Z7_STYLE|nr:UNKNOWN [Stylonychia lemnae]|eukprot:CDW89966.1 UNKNOWN [Stylonychia lemnae]
MVDWTEYFSTHLSRLFPGNLRLNPIFGETLREDPYYRASSKLKFQCQECQNQWTTAQGTVKFVYHRQRRNNLLFIEVFIYQQKCKRCDSWAWLSTYIDEERRLSKMFFGFIKQLLDRRFRNKERPQRESSAVTNHLTELCAACTEGCCVHIPRRGRR